MASERYGFLVVWKLAVRVSFCFHLSFAADTFTIDHFIAIYSVHFLDASRIFFLL